MIGVQKRKLPTVESSGQIGPTTTPTTTAAATAAAVATNQRKNSRKKAKSTTNNKRGGPQQQIKLQHQDGQSSGQQATNGYQQAGSRPNDPESVWIFGLINNIEQLLAQFNSVNNQTALQMQQQKQQQQQQQQSQRPLPSLSSSGYSTPASLSPPFVMSSSSSSSCSSSSYSTGSPDRSPTTAATTSNYTTGSGSQQKQQPKVNNNKLASTNQQVVQQQQQQQQQIPRSPLSRQIKFHEYKGPSQTKRPASNNNSTNKQSTTTTNNNAIQQQKKASNCMMIANQSKEQQPIQQQQQQAATALQSNDNNNNINHSDGSLQPRRQSMVPQATGGFRHQTSANYLHETSQSPICMEQNQIRIGVPINEQNNNTIGAPITQVSSNGGQHTKQIISLKLMDQMGQQHHHHQHQQHQHIGQMVMSQPIMIRPNNMMAQTQQQPPQAIQQHQTTMYITTANPGHAPVGRMGPPGVAINQLYGPPQGAILVSSGCGQLQAANDSDQLQQIPLMQRRQSDPIHYQQAPMQTNSCNINSINNNQVDMRPMYQHNNNNHNNGNFIVNQQQYNGQPSTTNIDVTDNNNLNPFGPDSEQILMQMVRNEQLIDTADEMREIVGDDDEPVDDTCDIEPTICFSNEQNGNYFDETLLFSEYIDPQDVPMNVNESDWLKKYLPPCSMGLNN